MKVLIAGSGIAGVSAAQKILQNDPSAQISLYDSEGLGLYARIRLPEYIAGSLAREKLFLTKGEQLQTKGINFIKDTIEKIDTDAHIVTLKSGLTDTYDRLLLCCGADARIPALPGSESCNQKIFTLRSMTDADRIIQQLEGSQSALLLGGGVLGLECAWHLRQRGINVTLLECLERLLPRQCTPEQSALLKSRLEECGVQIETGCQLQKIAHGGHYVDTLEITLSSGKVLTGDFLLISAGMSPRTAAAAASGIACKNGILVDNQMKTSAPDVYAAGDCAESETPNYGMWISAKDQGEALGNIITGKLTDFVLPARTPVLKIGQLDLTGIRSSRP